ncbi:MAG TPA: amidohydrolase family protein, partial [Candidatus Tumulicola sp.]
GGSDTPVCDLDPFAGMQAVVDHHQEPERLDPHEAMAMYTVNAARFGYVERRTGDLRKGFDADFIVVDDDPFDGARFDECRVLQTWIGGRCVYDAGTL